MTNVILRMRIHPLLSIPVLKSGRGRGWAPSCGKLDVNDEFDINALEMAMPLQVGHRTREVFVSHQAFSLLGINAE
jgi:hypothetical protein